MWDVEEIPNEDTLFYRIHRNNVKDGAILPGAFRERGEGEQRGMSTDWNKYSTAEEARSRARNPEDNSIVSFQVARIRSINGLRVQHAPLVDNRSHTNIKGVSSPLKTRIRMELKEIYQWEIKV